MWVVCVRDRRGGGSERERKYLNVAILTHCRLKDQATSKFNEVKLKM